MMPSPKSTAAKLRGLRSKHLPPAAYLRKLVEIADLDQDVGALGAGAPLADVDRVIELRDRIGVLEKRVRELEAHK